MTRPVPATAWLPARADLYREDSAKRTANGVSAKAGDLSLTVTIEERADSAGRRFAFRASRQAEQAALARRMIDQDRGRAFDDTDGQDSSTPIIDHRDAGNSTRFLAGAIAQARPDTGLHNPRYREAAGAYRRSNCLGLNSNTGARSDKRV